MCSSKGCVFSTYEEPLSFCLEQCTQLTTCGSCSLDENCIWCNNLGLCTSGDVYPVNYLYGECQSYAFGPDTCPSCCLFPICESQRGLTIAFLVAPCSSYTQCFSCMEDPACGWCRNSSLPSGGLCVDSTPLGPVSSSICSLADWTQNPSVCPAGTIFSFNLLQLGSGVDSLSLSLSLFSSLLLFSHNNDDDEDNNNIDNITTTNGAFHLHSHPDHNLDYPLPHHHINSPLF